jgi:hypothetical protein
MNPKKDPKTARRCVAAAIAAAVALLLCVIHARGPETARAGLSAKDAPSEDVQAARDEAAPGQVEKNAEKASEEPSPIIDEVRVEKDEVCAGEENLISVRAHTPNGTDAFLHYVIGAEPGAEVPLRVFPGPDGAVPRQTIKVFGRKNAVTEIPVPGYRIKDCKPQRMVMVTPRLLPNSTDEFELQARILPLGARDDPDAMPFEPVSYHWIFGDGSEETSRVPRVVHGYEGRSHESRASNYLVAVEVKDRSGEKLVGRRSLEIPSSVFENYAERGIVTVVAIPTPRFPEMDAEGVVRQSFRLRHHRGQPVRIERVRAVKHYMATGESSPPGSADGDGALEVSTIPPGEGVTVSLSLDTREERDVFAVTYMIEGVTADGIPARGSFSLMRPPPKPTRETSAPVSDPVLLAKILRARELLHQEFVTDEDIWRLEREGKLADLQIPAGKQAAPPAEAPRDAPPKKPQPGMPSPRGEDEAL